MECHTWVYRRIKSLSHEELTKEIDCVINERKNRLYMRVPAEEYASYMMKIFSRDSSLYKTVSYNTLLKRHSEICQENERIIKMLEIAKESHDYDVVTGSNGFSCTASDKDFINWMFDSPFRCIKYCDQKFTDADALINYLETIDPKFIYDSETEESGLTDNLRDKIYELFKQFGENNLIIEFG